MSTDNLTLETIQRAIKTIWNDRIPTEMREGALLVFPAESAYRPRDSIRGNKEAGYVVKPLGLQFLIVDPRNEFFMILCDETDLEEFVERLSVGMI